MVGWALAPQPHVQPKDSRTSPSHQTPLGSTIARGPTTGEHVNFPPTTCAYRSWSLLNQRMWRRAKLTHITRPWVGIALQVRGLCSR